MKVVAPNPQISHKFAIITFYKPALSLYAFRYGPKDISMMIYDYKVSTLVCGGGDGPHIAKAIVKKFLEFRKGAVCHCG